MNASIIRVTRICWTSMISAAECVENTSITQASFGLKTSETARERSRPTSRSAAGLPLAPLSACSNFYSGPRPVVGSIMRFSFLST